MIRLDKTICANLKEALSREWLETNALGGFACGTVAGANTRRYHGLLVAALHPPGGRMVLLSKLEEILVLGDRTFELSTNEYNDTIHPEGYLLLTAFRLDPFPIFTFGTDGVVLEKSIFMPQGSNAVQVEYRLLSCPATITPILELRPLIAFRGYHSTTHVNSALNPQFQSKANLLAIQPYATLPPLFFAQNAESVSKEGYWYRNLFYRLERERGLEANEDLFNPFSMRWILRNGHPAAVIASTEAFDIRDADRLRETELLRRRQVQARARNNDPFVQALTVAANQFLARRGADWTVIAGYPWFTDWGRDTMISLPGLSLYTGNAEVGKSILRNFARHVDQGMLPNRFADSGDTAEFNNVDATLWFFEAARAYAAATGDGKFLEEELYPVFVDILEHHIHGTRFNIRMLENGLLHAGAPGVQLTWMDGKFGDQVFTPRMGLPVEIQALWYNALRIMADLAQRAPDEDKSKQYAALAASASETFNRLFWNQELNCLYDVIDGEHVDPSVRPNQIFAVSLPHSMLAADRARAVVQIVERELLTPFGLRTLAPSDPRYRPRYEGGQYSRDSAYHQGTVWPWLLGAFIKGFVRTHDGARAAREHARGLLRELENHLTEEGLGQISEIFDADPPHQPRGCFAQAWSVAEILRALCEDIY